MTLITGSVANGATDTCWIQITDDGRFAYTANFGTGTISSYSMTLSDEISLVNPAAASLGGSTQPVDLAYVNAGDEGEFLYQLLRKTGTVAALRIEDDGSLTHLGIVSQGIPADNGASGLVGF